MGSGAQKRTGSQRCEWTEGSGEQGGATEGEIEHQVLLEGIFLDEQDRYLLEINIEDLDTSPREDQYY